MVLFIWNNLPSCIGIEQINAHNVEAWEVYQGNGQRNWGKRSASDQGFLTFLWRNEGHPLPLQLERHDQMLYEQ